jgi:hypothetical protein
LWGFLKDSVCWNNQHATEELKGEVTAAVKSITEETLAVIMGNCNRLQQMLLDAQD